jgi:hypothetical protein
MVEKIANEVWDGPYDMTKNPLLPTSFIWKLITHNGEGEKDANEKVWSHLTTDHANSMRTQQFEFSVWRTNSGLRMLFVVIEYIALTIGLFVSELCLRDAFNRMDAIKLAAEGRDITEDEYLSYTNAALSARDTAFSWDLIALSILIGSCRVFTIPLFQLLSGRRQFIFNIDWVINMILFLSTLAIFIPFSGSSGLGMEDIMKTGDEIVYLAEQIKNDDYTSILTAIIIFCLGIRIIYIMRFSQFLGPLITLLQYMVRKTIEFAVFYFLVIFVFALAATLLFPSEDPGFSRVDYIVLTLFQGAIGVIDLNPPEKYAIEGKVFYVIFVFLINIILLNFVVAILNEIYTVVIPKSKSAAYLDTISLRDRFKPHKTYQFMVSSYYVFDIILCILFLPIFPFLKESSREKLNSKLLYVEYTLCMLIIVPFYLAAELILVPVAYFVVLSSKLKILFRRNDGFWLRLLWSLLYLFLGVFMMLLYVCLDIYHFVIHSYTHTPDRRNDKQVEDYTSAETFKEIIDHMQNYVDEQAPCNVVIKGIETIFMRNETPSVMKQLILPSIEKRLIFATPFLNLSSFVRQFAGYHAKPQHVNLRVVQKILSDFLRMHHIKYNIKQGFIKSKAFMLQILGRINTNYSDTQNRVDVPLSDLIRFTEAQEQAVKFNNKKKICVASIKVYDKPSTIKAIEKYCVRNSTGVSVMIRLNKINHHIGDLNKVVFPQELRERTLRHVKTLC